LRGSRAFLPRHRLCRRLVSAVAVGLASLNLAPAVAAAAVSGSNGSGQPNTFVPTGALSVATSGQTATLLHDGDVLVAGGDTAAAELYDPKTGTFTPTAPMAVARTGATATLLEDGDVLVAGGCCRGTFQNWKTAELYDPTTGEWANTGSLNHGRAYATATLLPGGDVLVAGGACDGQAYGCDAGSFEAPQKSAELYDPTTGRWTMTGSMRYGRELQTATLLADGKVLEVGGFAECDDDFCFDNNSAELYDPVTAKWSRTGSMHFPREQQAAALLSDGDVLVAGGLNENGDGSHPYNYASAELYNPATGKWAITASMPERRAGATATLLPNGWVLVAGGQTTAAEVYEPTLAEWVPVGSLSTIRTYASATLLPDGEVLVAGGQGPDGQPQTTAELYTGGNGPLVVFSPTAVTFRSQQVGSTSSPLAYTVSNDGSANLNVAGIEITGPNPGDYQADTNCTEGPLRPGWSCQVSVVFAPTYTGLRQAQVLTADNAPLSRQGPTVSGYGDGPDVWVPTGSITTARDNATATPLANGEVLVAGGTASADESLATADLYHPATGTFVPTGSMNNARSSATAIRLGYGAVLMAGGYSYSTGPLSSAELYDPTTGGWTSITPMNQAGDGLTSVLLSGGDVLVTGFEPTSNGTFAEIYNPAKEIWTDTGTMPDDEPFGVAVALPDGDVLDVGGGTTAVDLFDPKTGSWTATGSLPVATFHPTATLLRDGEVLVAGGDGQNGAGPLDDAALYNPSRGTWTPTEPMIEALYGQSANLVPGGQVLLAGGLAGSSDSNKIESRTEVFDAGYWFYGPSMTTSRAFQTTTTLSDGELLSVGGESNQDGGLLATAEVYSPVEVRVSPARGSAGQKITLRGAGFYANEAATVRWGETETVIGRVKTTVSGTFDGQVMVPTTAKPGRYLIQVEGGKSFATATTTFTVT
jgi:N-acetylneuraminic acid mutarotase